MSNLFYEQLEKQSNGTDLKEFAIEELENIKAELNDYHLSNTRESPEVTFEIGKQLARKVIDEHISELKGETEC